MLKRDHKSDDYIYDALLALIKIRDSDTNTEMSTYESKLKILLMNAVSVEVNQMLSIRSITWRMIAFIKGIIKGVIKKIIVMSVVLVMSVVSLVSVMSLVVLVSACQ